MIKHERSIWVKDSSDELYYTTKSQPSKESIEFYSLETDTKESLPIDDFLDKFKWKSNIWRELSINF